jgi:hypothetical protein
MKMKLMFFLLLGMNFLNARTNFHPPDSLRNNLKPNAIGVSTGFFPIYVAWNLYYERRIFYSEQYLFKTFYLRASGGTWEALSPYGHHAGLSICGLTGIGKHHFELRFGATAIIETGRYKNEKKYPYNFPNQQPVLLKNYLLLWPSGSMGYRFQKPGGHFIFRTGAGYPEAIYVGLGLAF